MRMKWGGRLHRLWLGYECFGVSVKVVIFMPDDKTEIEREFDWEPPNWALRPICWARGHEPFQDGRTHCIVCRKVLRDRRADKSCREATKAVKVWLR